MFFLPEERRHHFREPFGVLSPSLDPILSMIDGKLFFSVGDVVTEHLLLAGRPPDIAILDGQTMRRPYEGVQIPQYRQINVSNPAGCITTGLIEAIEVALCEKRIVIQVQGEEDLAVVPLAMRAPDGSFILYGQPGEGVVLLEMTPQVRKKAEILFSYFVEES